ncbi:hypothetical protein [Methanosarcina mazei]|uniref:hypothetical protein n=1 Tax=Methanosarcina mazei TaxID=2209 RepID=UPI00064FAAB3|nr:hypothetical protein [Methanosarcina mazei]WIM42046.1 hypothetical protein PSF70_10905 [Methanosarcina mazei]WIM45496.1 hypothetical protein PQQ20_10830 [Methanosarcina mazei]
MIVKNAVDKDTKKVNMATGKPSPFRHLKYGSGIRFSIIQMYIFQENSHWKEIEKPEMPAILINAGDIK